MYTTVKQILNHKGHDIWSMRPDATVYEALQLMAEKNIGALLVIKDGDIMGIFSERDFARKGILQGKQSQDTPVSDLMTSDVLCISPTYTTEECMALMTEKHIRHLPVLEEGQVMGVISIGDVVKTFISEQEFVIEQLENYITGGR